ncbi:hypothetical protein B0H12DRAFT_327355 [Mycena haematopus]|nr:hypothetical protein B0H12DRAFT_327355 [Mycena haematopus]
MPTCPAVFCSTTPSTGGDGEAFPTNHTNFTKKFSKRSFKGGPPRQYWVKFSFTTTPTTINLPTPVVTSQRKMLYEPARLHHRALLVLSHRSSYFSMPRYRICKWVIHNLDSSQSSASPCRTGPRYSRHLLWPLVQKRFFCHPACYGCLGKQRDADYYKTGRFFLRLFRLEHEVQIRVI